jgi:hypothetical protein
VDVYHIMDIRLTTVLSSNEEDDPLNLLASAFSFAHITELAVRKPFFAFHDTTVSPTHRVMEPLRSRKCE